jgi:hypothetical protein
MSSRCGLGSGIWGSLAHRPEPYSLNHDYLATRISEVLSSSEGAMFSSYIHAGWDRCGSSGRGGRWRELAGWLAEVAGAS